MKRILIYTLLGGILNGCHNTPDNPVFPEKPDREAYEGFTWETIDSNGLKFWTQKNPQINIRTNPSIPGAEIVWQDHPKSSHTVMRLFYLPNKQIDDLLQILPLDSNWKEKVKCKFKEIPSRRAGVKRYILLPDGNDAARFREKSAQEPIPSTCNGWGIGNSGSRYFEIHANQPALALFVEIGQDAPLFDENSIVITGLEKPEDINPQIVKGTLRIGPEVRSLKNSRDQKEYWVIDKTQHLYELYDSLTQGIKNGVPVEAELVVKNTGKSDEGFAADYAATYEVIKIINLKEKKK